MVDQPLAHLYMARLVSLIMCVFARGVGISCWQVVRPRFSWRGSVDVHFFVSGSVMANSMVKNWL